MWEEDIEGNITMNIKTTDLNVLLIEEYAETDQFATSSGTLEGLS